MDYVHALATYCAVPRQDKTLENFEWQSKQGKSPLNKLNQAGKVLILVVTLNLGVITLDIKDLWDDFQLAGMKTSTSYLITWRNPYLTETAIGQHWLAHIGPHVNPTTLFWLKTLDHNSRNHISAWFNGEVNSSVWHLSTCISQIRPS